MSIKVETRFHSNLSPRLHHSDPSTPEKLSASHNTHMHSLDLSLSLHEDEFPLPGESPLQPSEVFLQGPVRSSVS